MNDKQTTLEQDVIHIFADGACTGNPGPAGIGAVLIYNGHTRPLSQFLGEATNNIAELTAVKTALEAITDKTIPVHLHLDSTYVIGLLSKNWKAKKNIKLVNDLRDLTAQFKTIKFKKVKAHSGDHYNSQADALARNAIKKYSESTDSTS